MQSGELTVTGHDHVEIPLQKLPSKVEAHFKDHSIPVPCNPHHRDELEYEVHSSILHHAKFVLKISWRVTGVREIVWHVYN
jgi:hypothetical protein